MIHSSFLNTFIQALIFIGGFLGLCLGGVGVVVVGIGACVCASWVVGPLVIMVGAVMIALGMTVLTEVDLFW